MSEILYKVPVYGKEVELKVVKVKDGLVKMNANDMNKINVTSGGEIDLIGPKTKTVQVFEGTNLGEIELPEEILNEILVSEGVILSVRKKYEV